MQSITKFAERAAIGLSTKTASKVEAKREIIRRLGLHVELDNDDKNRYVDALFIASGLSQINNTLRIARALGLQTIQPQLSSVNV